MTTPLLDIRSFNIVEDVVVGDRLHLIDLGVMKRLLLGWRDGTLGKRKWNDSQYKQVTDALRDAKLPTEIHRKLRSLMFVGQWKGSEFASFLHYASVVMLKDILATDLYKHFMLFFCATTLLSSSIYRDKWPLAGRFLDSFVEGFEQVYGKRYITSNVHNLQHIAHEVQRIGPLSTFSTYPFENKLQELKSSIRCGWKNLEQTIGRLSEYENFDMPDIACIKYPFLVERGGTVTVHVQRGLMLQNTERNCWFLVKDNSIIQFHNATNQLVEATENVRIRGRRVSCVESLFSEPIDSSKLFMFKRYTDTLAESYLEIKPDQIKCKLVALNTGSQRVRAFIPLIHT
uniref:Uncharacterized protein n=1 Tax=Anopheles atroparvus TaxID=41427 RepID=A0AAG5DQ99_ANOAO